MKERDRTVATSLVVLMLVVWLGFLVHRSPRFAGSFWGGVLGVSGSLMMLFPLLYLIVKRIQWLKKWVNKYASMRTLLAWHIYLGILGPILVLLHTGHKFESWLGIGLTAMTILVVLSGFVGRYLMNQFSQEIRDKKAMLTQLESAYGQAQTELARQPEQARLLRPFTGIMARVAGSLFLKDVPVEPGHVDPARMVQMAESMADVEYAVKTHVKFKAWFGKWLRFHIVISLILYVLLAFHVWASVYFGLRWFESWQPTTLDHDNPPRLAASTAAADEFSDHFARIYKRYWRGETVINGTPTTAFDYAGLAKEIKDPGSDFSQALAALRRVNPAGFAGSNREKAFWLNLYNFTAMKLAAEHYPIDSITNPRISPVGEPWSLKAVEVGGRRYSLSQIEKQILIPRFNDPRIVFAVSCAAVSCPDRTPAIFDGKSLDAQLDQMIRTFLANTRKGMLPDKPANRLRLSWILDADKKLFDGKNYLTLMDFLIRYAPANDSTWLKANRDKIKVGYFVHDWTLNDIAQADAKKK